MKSISLVGAMCASAAFAAAVPVIDDASVMVKQTVGKSVIIEYTMNPASAGDTEPAIITVDILTNAVGEAAASVGGEHLTTLAGDVNKVVTHTVDHKHKILWTPYKEGMPEFNLPAAQVTARITAWATNSPPEYWIIDLTQPGNRTADRYYPNAEQIPLGVTNAIYKSDRLVMRRIPAKGVTWKMGNSTSYGATTLHYVSFSRDYYMAIYEFTGRQYNHVRGSLAAQDDDALPVFLNFTDWRGTPTGTSEFNWPSNGHDKVDSGKLIGKLRTALGGIMLDLPTEAEWEYACRAGTSTKYCNGDTTADLDKVGWYSGNVGDVLIHEVGLKNPNGWGLYDMHGNGAEFCLDKYSKRGSDPVWDPKGPMQDEIDPVKPEANRFATIRGGGRWSSKYPTDATGANNCTYYYGACYAYSESIGIARFVLPLD